MPIRNPRPPSELDCNAYVRLRRKTAGRQARRAEVDTPDI
jgi:hypothetical protein